MAAEERVLNFLQQQNRPFNAQGVTDHLAQFGVKKAQAQKALDSLSENGKIKCKEFGKTKIYMIVQDDTNDLTKEEMEALQRQIAELTEQLQATGEDLRSKQKELQDLQCTFTKEEIKARTESLKSQLAEVNERLAPLRSGGAKVITPEERQAVEKAFSAAMDQWQKRKNLFKNIWDQVSENIDQNVRELWEEIGVETDEAADVDLPKMKQLLPKRARR